MRYPDITLLSDTVDASYWLQPFFVQSYQISQYRRYVSIQQIRFHIYIYENHVYIHETTL